MNTNPSPENILAHKLSFFSTLNESQRRKYLGTEALALGKHGVSKVSNNFNVSKNTVYCGIKEINSNYSPETGKVRRPGGGRKRFLDSHMECIETFKIVTESSTAGLPQDEKVIWVSMSVRKIKEEMGKLGCNVSEYIVYQIFNELGYRKRSFIKDLPLKEAENRDAQFRNIAEVRKAAESAGIPIISIDTKKKELIGNFKREGKVYSKGQPKSYDHDFPTFSNGQIVPHGIYDVTKNIGFLSIGTSHDTSSFVCDNIERVWKEYLMYQYPGAETLMILGDGGGSNSSSHNIVKQDLLKLASKLNINLLVMHYPPYCSKWNPIEHRLFSQITRSWAGAPLESLENAIERARGTTTKTGLVVHVDLNTKTYDIKRPINDDFERESKKRIIFQSSLPKWNYLVKRQ